ncbi:UPF0692 protein C19orf54 homolog [Centruroides sculpturatus]|uniref:UPF0692 protein C19orf54 homolog n=1 Tax=Centruroides sculpturatus TaxID=218467 RepID=UPI000C6E1CE8|nr:UPF0692 protein C19orf54 homolog [Centruroides sculpturatus]
MGSKIPQAPIPPPLPPSIPTTFNAKITTENTLLSQETEITKACQASWNYITNGKVDSFIISVYHQVKPILQDGPKCGLVALCMASQLLSKTLMVDAAFERAKELRFTKKGEMFSESYDADSNHEPCCKKGHTAHWAVITGFCIIIDENQCESLKLCSKDTDPSHIIHWKNNSFPFNVDENTPVFVFARQGKSSRVQIWNFDQLCKSNKNLSEFSVKHIASDFILPKNGIQNELSNHAILLNKC